MKKNLLLRRMSSKSKSNVGKKSLRKVKKRMTFLWCYLPSRYRPLFNTRGGGGEGVGEYLLCRDKVYLMPTFTLSWRRPILLPFPPENHVICQKILQPPSPGESQWLRPYEVILVAQCWKRLLLMTLSVNEVCCKVKSSCKKNPIETPINFVTRLVELQRLKAPRNPIATNRKYISRQKCCWTLIVKQ